MFSSMVREGGAEVYRYRKRTNGSLPVQEVFPAPCTPQKRNMPNLKPNFVLGISPAGVFLREKNILETAAGGAFFLFSSEGEASEARSRTEGEASEARSLKPLKPLKPRFLARF